MFRKLYYFRNTLHANTLACLSLATWCLNISIDRTLYALFTLCIHTWNSSYDAITYGLSSPSANHNARENSQSCTLCSHKLLLAEKQTNTYCLGSCHCVVGLKESPLDMPPLKIVTLPQLQVSHLTQTDYYMDNPNIHTSTNMCKQQC